MESRSGGVSLGGGKGGVEDLGAPGSGPQLCDLAPGRLSAEIFRFRAMGQDADFQAAAAASRYFAGR
eukprot:6101461-Pyramimonas_sp.AAC.1